MSYNIHVTYNIIRLRKGADQNYVPLQNYPLNSDDTILFG